MSSLPPTQEDKEVKKVTDASSLNIASTEESSSINQEKQHVSSSSTPPSLTTDKAVDAEGIDKAENGEGGLEDESLYLSGMKLGLVMLGLGLAALLVGLVSHPPTYLS